MRLKSITTVSNTTTDLYPFNTHAFSTLSLSQPITFFTGDNGSGKSTLLRIIKELAQAIDIGNGRPFDPETIKLLPDHYRLTWSQKTKRGFYLQSEDFLNYIQWAHHETGYYQQELEDVNARHTNKQTMEYLLESGVHRGNIQHMNRIVETLGNVSHGEGYLEFFKTRITDNALYLLDEPETPLSFHSQLAFMTLIKDAIDRGCQFIMCTHSPILLAYPQATIYHFDEEITAVSYDDHPLVTQTRSFLEDPKRYLHYLLND